MRRRPSPSRAEAGRPSTPLLPVVEGEEAGAGAEAEAAGAEGPVGDVTGEGRPAVGAGLLLGRGSVPIWAAQSRCGGEGLGGPESMLACVIMQH